MIAIIGVVIAATVYVLWPGNVYYSIAVRNHTDKGVIIYPAQGKKQLEPGAKGAKWRISPGIPGVGADIIRIPPFEIMDVPRVSASENYSKGVPEEIKIRWQRAKLSNCQDTRRSQGYRTINGRQVDLNDGKTYTRREGCDWEPYGSIEAFSVPKDWIRSTEDYEEVDNASINVRGGPAVLDVTFVFDDQGLHVETGWGYTP